MAREQRKHKYNNSSCADKVPIMDSMYTPYKSHSRC